jgi:predicted TIM-barrel fold metal-dependent hydrolase
LGKYIAQETRKERAIMIIDFENHIYLPEQVVPGKSQSGKLTERHWEEKGKLRIRIFEDATNVDQYLQFMDDAGINIAVLTANSFTGGLEQMKRWNNFCAQVVKENPSRLVGFACVPPLGGQPALEELERAVKELGMKGVHIWTRSDGHHLDDREMWPFYEKVTELKLPVDVHVTLEPSGLEAMHSDYGLYYVLAREFDMAIATLRVCLGGVLEDFPDLVLVMNHLGGGVSSVLERLEAYMDYLGSGWDSFYSDKPLISRPWKEYWNKLYFNVAGREAGIASVKCALSNIKPEKLIFGTDWPFNYDYRPQAVKDYAEEIRKLDLPAGSAEAILGTNAAKILGLKIGG